MQLWLGRILAWILRAARWPVALNRRFKIKKIGFQLKSTVSLRTYQLSKSEIARNIGSLLGLSNILLFHLSFTTYCLHRGYGSEERDPKVPHGSIGHQVLCEDPISGSYLLGEIPLTSQKESEVEEMFKFHCDSNAEKEDASVIDIVGLLRIIAFSDSHEEVLGNSSMLTVSRMFLFLSQKPLIRIKIV